MQFKPGENTSTLRLTGRETYSIRGITGGLKPRQDVVIRVVSEDGKAREFSAIARLDTQVEIDYYRNGGVLHTVLRRMLSEN